jgi:nicotinamide mononucleotide transporter
MTLPSPLEIAANAFNAAAILFAMLNSVHTWWLSIVGCALFGLLFYDTQLYADTTLQLFFIGASIAGWFAWLGRTGGEVLPVRHVHARSFSLMVLVAVGVAAAYGWLLHRFTDAYAPFWDSIVLTFSVVAQLLLVRRYYESWWLWLVVNTIAVPLYFSRGLNMTAVLYIAFWINAMVALVRWKKLIVAGQQPKALPATSA